VNIFCWSHYEKGGEGLSRHIIFIASFLQNKQCLYLFILKAFSGSDSVYLVKNNIDLWEPNIISFNV